VCHTELRVRARTLQGAPSPASSRTARSNLVRGGARAPLTLHTLHTPAQDATNDGETAAAAPSKKWKLEAGGGCEARSPPTAPAPAPPPPAAPAPAPAPPLADEEGWPAIAARTGWTPAACLAHKLAVNKRRDAAGAEDALAAHLKVLRSLGAHLLAEAEAGRAEREAAAAAATAVADAATTELAALTARAEAAEAAVGEATAGRTTAETASAEAVAGRAAAEARAAEAEAEAEAAVAEAEVAVNEGLAQAGARADAVAEAARSDADDRVRKGHTLQLLACAQCAQYLVPPSPPPSLRFAAKVNATEVGTARRAVGLGAGK